MSTAKALAVLTAALASALAVEAAARWTVSLRSGGPLRMGMSVPELRVALDDPQADVDHSQTDPPPEECAYLESAKLPAGVGAMLQAGRLVRIDVSEPSIPTAAGVAVGDSEAAVLRAYAGRATVRPHHYDPEQGHYIEVLGVAADAGYELLFETDGDKVTSYRTGTLAAVGLVEGCQ